ncbi:hypothetical protein CL1_0069 [Thermococcus cleftensis]|uniref:Uncharacterized protein n=2 Tax=Thermococcus cleftensis (strain DSM 27260 / KACC 17922 / CL1) TaxID=163003 RepID=I3ZRF0_THECF|nr:hypothetical protein CL1_0069 [Thermococcus cleftensis]
MDDLKEFIEKEAKDPEKTLQYLEELRQVLHKHIKPKGIQPPAKGAPTTKIITQKIPSEVEEAFRTLNGLDINIKLETGDVEERKSKIFSWLVKNGLIEVGEENGKPVVKASDKLREILGKQNPKAVAAMIKWAAEEEGTTLEHVEPVAKVLAALEEFRQISKKKDPALAKALEKAMKSKHTIREIYYMLQGVHTPEELSQKWSEKFGTISLVQMFERYPELAKATLDGIENAKENFPPVPAEWAKLIDALERGELSADELRRRAGIERMFFSALESLAIRGLPEDGKDVVNIIDEILDRSAKMLPWAGDVPKDLRTETEELSLMLALMKDGNFVERLEAELAPIIEKIPESRKVGLFRRESPRRKVEDFVGLLMEGEIGEERAEKKARELVEYLGEYIGDEAEGFVERLLLPYRAKRLLNRYGNTEDFLFEYSHGRAARLLIVEAHLAETIEPDALVKPLIGMPSLSGRKRVPPRKLKKTEELLRKILG